MLTITRGETVGIDGVFPGLPFPKVANCPDPYSVFGSVILPTRKDAYRPSGSVSPAYRPSRPRFVRNPFTPRAATSGSPQRYAGSSRGVADGRTSSLDLYWWAVQDSNPRRPG